MYGQFVQGFIHSEQLLITASNRDIECGQVDALLATAVFKAMFTPGILDENPAHRFGGCGEKVGTIGPRWLGIGSKPKPGQGAEELLPIVYEELRRLAANKMTHEAPGQTLQPTALVQ